MGNKKDTVAQPTLEELVALLKKTTLPTVICEGADDLIVYRRLEDRLSHLGVSILPVGGRVKVLELFERKAEFSNSIKIAFVADQDFWINTGIPPQYVSKQLIFTFGYSIENDVFCDGALDKLLVGAEINKFTSELESFVEWYALALSRHIVDRSHAISLHPEHVLDTAQRPALMALGAGETYPIAVRDAVLGDYKKMLRGKSLIALLIRNTNSRGAQPRHNDKSLMETVAARPGQHLLSTAHKLEQIFTS